MKTYFGREPEANINPDEVVAVGASIHAQSLSGQGSDTYLLDVTPLSLRLGIAGGMTESIIERNSPVPIDHTRTVNPVKDGQESVCVKIYQGESRTAEGNELLGQFEFSGYQPGPRDQVQLEVSFEISTEGIVKVSACDPKTGVQHSTTVSMSSGLSENELRAIIERGRAEDVARQSANAPPPDAMGSFERENPDHKRRSGQETIPLPADDDLLDLPSDGDDGPLLLDDEPAETALDPTFDRSGEDLMPESDDTAPMPADGDGEDL